MLTNLKWVELNTSFSTSTSLTDVSMNKGKVKHAPVTMTNIRLFMTDFHGLVVSVKFRYSIGWRMARKRCLAIKVVKKVDEYRMSRLKGWRTYENMNINQDSEIPWGLLSQAGHIISVSNTHEMYTVCKINRHINSLLNMLFNRLLHRTGIAIKFETMPTPPSTNWQKPSIQYETVWICSISDKLSLYSTHFQCKEASVVLDWFVILSIAVSFEWKVPTYWWNVWSSFCQSLYELA